MRADAQPRRTWGDCRRLGGLAALGALTVLASCGPNEAAYYARLETDLRAAGFMRTDRAPQDARFSNADLAQNFERIALYSEYDRAEDRFVRRRTPSVLSKWTDPVRIRFIFGNSVTASQRRQDRRDVSTLSTRLSSLTGLGISMVTEQTPAPNANFVLIFADRAERAEIAQDIRIANPQADPAFIASLRDSTPQEICYVNTFRDPDHPGRIVFAVAVIKSETRGLMRLSCLHEEISQAFGLGNDDMRVRPSIFNDDEEFALLTEHDEYLLRVLYHPALSPGMSQSEVRARLPGILAELRPGG
ncbi:MAG: DUF2927 domain-containing protein [Pseudomonadota bacterium]